MPKPNIAEILEQAPVPPPALSLVMAAEIMDIRNISTILLDPQDVLLDPMTDVRHIFPGDTKNEARKLSNLVADIRDNGQTQAGLVRPAANGKGRAGLYRVVAGRRRLQACAELGVKFLATVQHLNDEQARRAAISENVQREGFSPIQFALLCQDVRKHHGWTGGVTTSTKTASTLAVADYFHVSPATIRQHEKLLALPRDIQAQLHAGSMSREAAFELLRVEEGAEREKAAAQAVEEAKNRAKNSKTAARAAKKAATPSQKPAAPIGGTPSGRERGQALSGYSVDSGKLPKPPKTPPVEAVEVVEEPDDLGVHVSAADVRRAIKKTAAKKADGAERTNALNRRELLEALEPLGSRSIYPSPLCAFVEYFTGPFAEGRGSYRILNGKWNQIASLVDDTPKKSPKKLPKG